MIPIKYIGSMNDTPKHYRIYFSDSGGRFRYFEDIEAFSDKEAVRIALFDLGRGWPEVWCGAKMIWELRGEASMANVRAR